MVIGTKFKLLICSKLNLKKDYPQIKSKNILPPKLKSTIKISNEILSAKKIRKNNIPNSCGTSCYSAFIYHGGEKEKIPANPCSCILPPTYALTVGATVLLLPPPPLLYLGLPAPSRCLPRCRTAFYRCLDLQPSPARQIASLRQATRFPPLDWPLSPRV